MRTAVPSDPPPDFLVVEAGGDTQPQWEDLDELLDRCEERGVPRLLWIACDRPDPRWLERCARFDRVFTTDTGQLERLEELGASMPSVLWPATSLPIEEEPPGERPTPVLWLGGWRRDWPEEWAKRLTAVLRGAAEHGLRIVAVHAMDGMPEELRPYLAAAEPVPEEAAVAELRRAQVVVCADPVAGSPTFAPQAVFDAATCGAVVVTPHRFANRNDFGAVRRSERRERRGPDGRASNPLWDLVPYVADGEAAAERIGLLLGDETLREESARHLRRIVRNNHTRVHRLAGLASAAGRRVAPDARASAPKTRRRIEPTRGSPPTIQHLLATRFFVQIGWDPSPQWLAERLRLLRRFTLPSVAAQTAGSFTWLLLCDEAIDPAVLEQLRDEERRLPSLRLAFTGKERTAIDVVRRAVDPTADVLITTRLDSDDAIVDGYLEAVQEYAASFRSSDLHRLLVNFAHGYRLDVAERRFHASRMTNNAFHSLFERPGDGPAQTVMSAGDANLRWAWYRDYRYLVMPGIGGANWHSHAHLHQHYQTHQDESMPAWLVAVHGHNVLNRIEPDSRPMPEGFRPEGFSIGDPLPAE